jgi:hypothetical protein
MLPAFKMPEPMFAVINPVMKLLLRSPLHGVLSSGIMLITFQGKKSGRWFTTPVRYIHDDNTVRAFSSTETVWWRNLVSGADVTLRLKGKDHAYHAVAVRNNPELIRRWMDVYLDRYPEDRVYHDIGLNKDGSFVEADIERAVGEAVLVEATPVQ